VNVREVLNGIFYVLWTGCQWKALPKDLPPKSMVHDYLELWSWDGTLERILEGREASPTVGPARLRCLLFLLCASLGRGTRGRNRRSECIVRQSVPDLAAAEQ
jgi:transposase